MHRSIGRPRQPGGIKAFDLATGNEKWKWTGDAAAYASPVVTALDGKQAVVAETAASIVAVGLDDGKLLWRSAIAGGKGGGKGRPGKGGAKGGFGRGRGMGGMAYNAPTPIVDGTLIVYSDGPRSTKAVTVEKKGDELSAKDLWNNSDQGLQFNSPVLKSGFVYGITRDDKLFCINAKSGKTEWTEKIKGGGRPGYGSVVDAGSVLFSLTPAGELIVFQPTDKEFKQIAKYNVGADTYAYPIIAGNRIIVKDKDSVKLFVIE